MTIFDSVKHVLFLAILLLILLLAYQQHRYKQRTVELDRLTQLVTEKNTQLTIQTKQLTALQQLATTHNQAQLDLREQLINVNSHLQQRTRQLETLKHENALIQQWADSPLPTDIQRLQQRPAITGSAAYHQWLSASQRLPSASEPAADQRPVID